VTGALVLEDVRSFVRRYVVATDEQLDMLALWIAHTYVYFAFYCTPYLNITSPEKRSGKTRLLEVLDLVVREAIQTVNISDAALFRAINEKKPTLLIDEVDALFGKKSPREELRGILNAGYRQGSRTYRMGGKNNTTLQEFDVYCPKAFAGIGDSLPDTITDRSVCVRLTRRTRDTVIERFRIRDAKVAGDSLRDRLSEWLEGNHDYLAESRPELSDALDDRAQDVWEPLFAVADLAGDDWPQRARRAALVLSTGDERRDDSTTAILIRDIHGIFVEVSDDHIKSSDLLARLHEIEDSPWGDWYGKPITVQKLSSLLSIYGIRTMSVWIQGATERGYKIEQFSEAFSQFSLDARVEGSRGSRGSRPLSFSEAGTTTPNAPNALDANERCDGDQRSHDVTLASERDNIKRCSHDSRWLARDGKLHCFVCEPPVSDGEVVEYIAVSTNGSHVPSADEICRTCGGPIVRGTGNTATQCGACAIRPTTKQETDDEFPF
jgi:hypothetical protein